MIKRHDEQRQRKHIEGISTEVMSFMSVGGGAGGMGGMLGGLMHPNSNISSMQHSTPNNNNIG